MKLEWRRPEEAWPLLGAESYLLSATPGLVPDERGKVLMQKSGIPLWEGGEVGRGSAEAT